MGHAARVLASLLLITVLGGCTSVPTPTSSLTPQMSVTYFTDPPNASLYAISGMHGPTPLTLQYDIPADFTDCVELEGLQVVWASGARQTVQLSACPGDALERQFTVKRPALPGREVDLWYATRVAELGLLPVDKDTPESHAGAVLASKR